MIEVLKCIKCGKIPEVKQWSASTTCFVKCECGNDSGDYTSENYDWAAKKAIRAWNRQNKSL